MSSLNDAQGFHDIRKKIRNGIDATNWAEDLAGLLKFLGIIEDVALVTSGFSLGAQMGAAAVNPAMMPAVFFQAQNALDQVNSFSFTGLSEEILGSVGASIRAGDYNALQGVELGFSMEPPIQTTKGVRNIYLPTDPEDTRFMAVYYTDNEPKTTIAGKNYDATVLQQTIDVATEHILEPKSSLGLFEKSSLENISQNSTRFTGVVLGLEALAYFSLPVLADYDVHDELMHTLQNFPLDGTGVQALSMAFYVLSGFLVYTGSKKIFTRRAIQNDAGAYQELLDAGAGEEEYLYGKKGLSLFKKTFLSKILELYKDKIPAIYQPAIKKGLQIKDDERNMAKLLAELTLIAGKQGAQETFSTVTAFLKKMINRKD